MAGNEIVPGRSHVCEICKLLEFDKAFSVPTDRVARRTHPGVLIARLGARHPQLGSCEVCQLLWNAAFWPDAGKHDPPPGTRWELRAYSVDETSFHYPSTELGNIQEKGVCLVLVPEHRTILANDEKLRNFLCTNGHIVCSMNLHLHEPGKRRPRLIPPSYDPHRAESWLHLCRDVHGVSCNGRAPLADFRLVDCATLAVIDVTDPTSYVALSYVWAIAQDSHPNPNTYGDNIPDGRRLPETIPGVVLDAIEVAKSLGYQYIWIDRYCIDQSDAEHVEDQISKMDRIYREADLTIIAASWQNGLPGVGTTPRTLQKVVQFQNGLTLFVMPSISRDKSTSPWSFRGWTYQEEVLSRRRLYFMNHEMLFECNGSLACWESMQELSVDTATKLPIYDVPHFGESREPDLTRTLYKYYGHVSSFTRRYLSYDSDTLNAFSGIMNTFRPGHSFDWLNIFRKASLYPFHGIASITPEESNFSGSERKVLALGLGWVHHSTKARKTGRKPDFPSFSWAGWHGLVTIRYDIDNFSGYSDVLELIQPSSLGFGTGLNGLRLSCPAIRLLATVIPNKMMTFVGKTWRNVSFLQSDCFYGDGEVEPLGRAPQEFMTLLETKKLMCVLLGGQKVPDSLSGRVVVKWRHFELYVLVLEQEARPLSNINDIPVVQRDGMLIFRHELGTDEAGAGMELFEMSLLRELEGFPKRDILIV